MVVIGAPHTSNWDFFLFLAALHYFGIHVSFIGKHTLFRWPFGGLFRRWGGVPVDRSKPGGIVTTVSEAFAAADEMILVVAPEGTRKHAKIWRTGFLGIAEAAGVPVVPASVDGASKSVEIGQPIEPTVGRPEMMSQIRDYYADKGGLRPDLKGPVILNEEVGS